MRNPLPGRANGMLIAPTILFAVWSTGASSAGPDSTQKLIPTHKLVTSTFSRHCVKCHGKDQDVAGDIDLLRLDRDDLADDAELLRSIVDVLELQRMPPQDEPPLPAKRRQRVIEGLKQQLRTAVSKQSTLPHTPLRRMNRFQYDNAVVDLLDLRCVVFSLPERMMRDHKNYFQPASGKMAETVTVGSRPLGKSQLIEPRLAGVAAFPQDPRAEHGYDNQADHLSMSPLLMESFLKLGQSITQSPDFGPKRVGRWNSLFETPPTDADLDHVLRQRLEPFLSQAFRRPVENAALNRYVNHAMQQIDSGKSFVDAMKSVVSAAISSPRFLYLYRREGDGGTNGPGRELELASRLSFFLWGSVPDQTLLDLAVSGELGKPEVLDVQIDRMLSDEKIKRFCDSFPSQWLQLERIVSSIPNPEKFPNFYFSKFRDSMHMMLEPLLLFETVLIENRPITELIDPDFTYRSRILEEAYGELGNVLPESKRRGGGVTVLNFHRVPVTDRRNGGVITNAAVMTMTSGPDRTQPITRGAWIATVIFHNPPKPPPADVPPLDEKPREGEEHLTLRERLAAHRQRSDCKGCHEQIDPLGFALENYDPIGVWRDKYENGRDVDTSGTLFRTHRFRDVSEFKDALLAEKDRFTRALAGHLMTFGLARPLGPADQIALDKITRTVADDGYRMRTLIKQVILSEPFLNQPNHETP